MSFNEADTRAKLVDPALHACGWTEEMIRREETAGAIEIMNGRPRRTRGRIDYCLRAIINPGTQPLAVALIEAKAESLPPTHGLEQVKVYAKAARFNVPFVFSSNGHRFVEFDRISGRTSAPQEMAEFPSPETLLRRWQEATGIRLDQPLAQPLLVPYSGGETSRRYYQDAAIRAVLEKLARGEKRALLSLATGAGKTFIAVHLLEKLARVGLLKRALFVCDRDELRTQGLAAFKAVFGADAAEVHRAADGANNARNARVHIATFQTLGIDREDGDASFLTTHYPADYFSHIVIDECHRSAWGKWSEVLRRNPDAVQIGLTATPRQLEVSEDTKEADDDRQLAADNLRHFGEPVYAYDMAQGIEDGYLAACEIVRRDIFLDDKPQNERETGVEQRDLAGKTLRDARTGRAIALAEAQARYQAETFEDRIQLPERVAAMCSDLFRELLATGGPEQKTIVFCARDSHADRVANELNNLYADWCAAGGHVRTEPYAFKCTAESGGSRLISDFRGSTARYIVATTVDLLTTGVDVPKVRNIVFFRYVGSAISFYQMVGRGTRLDLASGKLMFRVYDYTDATRLFGQSFLSRANVVDRPTGPDDAGRDPHSSPEPLIEAEGFSIRVTPAGKLILTEVDGRAVPMTVEDYKARLAARLVAEAPTLGDFRAAWVVPERRRDLLGRLPEGGRSAIVLRRIEAREDFDLYDILAEAGYGAEPRSRRDRADAFLWKHATWLSAMPPPAIGAIRAVCAQFAKAGTEGLESPSIFATPELRAAGGLAALRSAGRPAELLRETKERIFAA